MANKKNGITEETNEQIGLEELATLQAENEELKNKLLRAQADFDNYRKRTTQEKNEIAAYVNGQFMVELLPVWDNFDRAVATANQAGNAEGLVEGIAIVYRQFIDKLTAAGLVEIAAQGETFDPEYHQAVMQVEGGESGKIADVIQKGYTFKERVIRPAMVSVYK
jgi:molecular chaperone GrpE